MKPNASKENTIHGGVEGDCCLCGCHTHHGTPGYKGEGTGHIVYKQPESDRRWFQGLVLLNLGEEIDRMLEKFSERQEKARQIIITGPRPDLEEPILEYSSLPVGWMDWDGLGNIDGWAIWIDGAEMSCWCLLRFET